MSQPLKISDIFVRKLKHNFYFNSLLYRQINTIILSKSQSNFAPSRPIAPKDKNGGLGCFSSLTESTTQANCLDVMRFGNCQTPIKCNGPAIWVPTIIGPQLEL